MIFDYEIMTKLSLISCFLLFSLISHSVLCFKPVVLLHGVLTGQENMQQIANRITEKHPGTIVYNIDRFAGWSSLEPMWHQVLEIGNDLINISNKHPEGIHFLGYSQGGLLARVILESFPEHNVQNFISLSSPQAGQYGTAFLHLFFPNLACKTAFELFYSRLGQRTSVGNYWNDPHEQKLYQKYSVFLPYVNNEIKSNRTESFKRGLLKLQKFVLIGGPDDEVITPWQSSHFGYFDANETIIELRNSALYMEDKLGLKTLDENEKLVLYEIPGVSHFGWHINMTIIDKYVLPYLN